MNFSEALESLIPYMDDVYDRWAAEAKQLRGSLAATNPEARITCTKGCGACCHFPLVPVTAGEAFVLLARLLASGRDLEELSALFREYASAYFAACRDWGGLPFTDDRQTRFLARKLPCPLFVKTPPPPEATPAMAGLGGHCGAFEARPMICDYFHSTESPALCVAKKPHGSFTQVVQRGEAAVEEIRNVERALFGRSAIGHLPLFLAALCTRQGMELFLEEYELTPEQVAEDEAEETRGEGHGQHAADFEFYIALMECAGYLVTAEDLHNLIAAQEGMKAGG
jgi:hypothetical protein